MSQTYQELQGNTPLTSSRPIINNNMDALKTNFSGTAAPFTASADTLGATYYNTTDRKTYQVVASGSSYIWALPPENVHTSGDESIAGAKTFTSDITAPNITTLTSTVSTLSSTAAHLAGTETFTGNKTFSGTVALGSSATAETKTVSTNSTAVATTAYVKLAVPVSIGSNIKPVYTNASGVLTASNADVGSSTQPVYMDKGEIKAITGAIANSTTGNAATATTLATARTINGTPFDGSSNITTSCWGISRNVTIKDADETNAGTAVSVNGSDVITLKLPATIKATLSGNATSASIATTQANTDNSTNIATTAFVHNILDTLYPVDSIYIGTQATCPLATLISGSTWTKIEGRYLLASGTLVGTTEEEYTAKTEVSAGLPNITGAASVAQGAGYDYYAEGAFYKTTDGSGGNWDTGAACRLKLDASRSSSIYGASSTVRAPAYVVNVWRRTA